MSSILRHCCEYLPPERGTDECGQPADLFLSVRPERSRLGLLPWVRFYACAAHFRQLRDDLRELGWAVRQ